MEQYFTWIIGLVSAYITVYKYNLHSSNTLFYTDDYLVFIIVYVRVSSSYLHLTIKVSIYHLIRMDGFISDYISKSISADIRI